jgi:hypothetical protein
MIFLVALYYYAQMARLVTAMKELHVRIVEEQYGLETHSSCSSSPVK